MKKSSRERPGSRRVSVIAVAAAMTASAAPLAAATPAAPSPDVASVDVLSRSARHAYGLADPGAGRSWALRSERRGTDTARTPSGQTVTTHGVHRYFVEVLTPEASTGAPAEAAVTAAGCGLSTYVSYPYRVFYSSGRYAAQAYTKITNGSGCPREYTSATLREEQGWRQPIVASGSLSTAPGTTRYLYLTYPCGSAAYRYSHISYGNYFTSAGNLCP